MKNFLNKFKNKEFRKKLFVMILAILFLAGTFLPTLVYLL
jgi:preprotein translocase subunit SecY